MPTDPASATAVAGIAERAASLLETTLRSDKPTIVAIGTGRAMRAAVEQIPPMDCPDHQLVSLVGNISTDGSATFFDTVARLADLTKARHYPMPLPVLMSSEAERDQMLKIRPVERVHALGGKGGPAPDRHRANGQERRNSTSTASSTARNSSNSCASARSAR